MGKILFASLYRGVFALKSPCLIEWIRLKSSWNTLAKRLKKELAKARRLRRYSLE
jgi:hypothetical protein